MSGEKDATTMRVVLAPTTELTITNFAHCSPSQFSLFTLPKVDLKMPKVDYGWGRVNGTFIYKIQPHCSVQEGFLALNSFQRRSLKVSEGDSVSVDRDIGIQKDLVVINVELEFVTKGKKPVKLDATILSKELAKRYSGQILALDQKVPFEYQGTKYAFSVVTLLVTGERGAEGSSGCLTDQTVWQFETPADSGIQIVHQKGGQSTNLFKTKHLNFEKLGIGGLDSEFADIFRRAFASRTFPPNVIAKLGIQHVKGILLFGPPGTGKTLIARKIGKLLNAPEPKVVNGPQVLSKFVGETEKNIRDLFADAEHEQKTRGEESALHIIIFDELDSICRARGSTRDGTGVHDSIVNQLLTMIDGVEALNNILLIGMTNRKDLLDEALLRPGRMEVQIEIGLPDEKGRVQVLSIHSSKMKENSFLGSDVNLERLASMTQNFSGAELEGLVKSAASFALIRQLNPTDLSEPIDEENIKVTMADFRVALNDVKPAFGVAANTLEMCRLNKILPCGDAHARILETAETFVEQVKNSQRTPLLTCLLEGPSGTGKTALAATIAIDSNFPFIKVVSAENMLGLQEHTKSALISAVFEAAYKSPLSIIILDDIERLLEFVRFGGHFSNLILQTLLVLVKRIPPEGRKLLVIGTTSERAILDDMGLVEAFNVRLTVPKLQRTDLVEVLKHLAVFDPADMDSAVAALGEEMPIKKLLMLIEMAAQGKGVKGAADANGRRNSIDVNRFRTCLRDIS